MDEPNPIAIGIDVGQIQDNTAIAVAEIVQKWTGKYRFSEPVPARFTDKGEWVPPKGADPVMRSEYTIRHITRLPLRTSYPDVALHIADMLCSPLFVGRHVRVLIDVTGVGRPVYDDLKKEIDIRKHGVWRPDGTFHKREGEICNPMLQPISFVHGEKYNRTLGTLGKAYLVSRLQSLLQAERIHGPDTPEMRMTCEELRVYEIKISDDGKDQYGSFKTGTHDDLATALGLATLTDPFSEQVNYSNRVY